MQFTYERPDFRYVMRAVADNAITVNDRVLRRSFIVSSEVLLEDWAACLDQPLTASDLEPLFALQPELLVLGTGPRLRFPSPAVQAAALSRGIGIECMDNAAAARTFNLLAGERRRVVAGFVL